MAGMDQKDFFALIVVNGSCMVKAGFTGYVSPRSFSLRSVCRPVMFGIMADMDQKVCCETALVVGIGIGLYMAGFAGFFTSRSVPFPGVQAQMLGIMAGMNRKDFFVF